MTDIEITVSICIANLNSQPVDGNIADIAINTTPIIAYFDQSVTLHAPFLTAGQLSTLDAVLLITFEAFAA